jgi:hypothetical protein
VQLNKPSVRDQSLKSQNHFTIAPS